MEQLQVKFPYSNRLCVFYMGECIRMFVLQLDGTSITYHFEGSQGQMRV